MTAYAFKLHKFWTVRRNVASSHTATEIAANGQLQIILTLFADAHSTHRLFFFLTYIYTYTHIGKWAFQKNRDILCCYYKERLTSLKDYPNFKITNQAYDTCSPPFKSKYIWQTLNKKQKAADRLLEHHLSTLKNTKKKTFWRTHHYCQFIQQNTKIHQIGATQ